MTAILGVSAFYHDSAAALLVDGEVVAACQEERFTRVKHDEAFPVHAIRECLRLGGLEPGDLDYVGFYDKPLLKFERLLETHLSFAPRSFQTFLRAMPVWLRQKLHLPREMRQGLGGDYQKRFVFLEHHESHAASAFYPSPFEEAAILTVDGVGEWATASFGVGRGRQLELSHEMRFPHSLGLLYSAFTAYCGFRVNDGEYKLMGLAPYGEPRFVDTILQHLLHLHEDGSFRLDMKYFDFCHRSSMTSARLHALLGGPPRREEEPLTQRHMDVAASIQKVTEEVVLRIARHVHQVTGQSRLCLAGGVALNCVANGRLLQEGPFQDLWIQPAAGDAGGALGTAWFVWHHLLGKERTPLAPDAQRGSLLGPAHEAAAIQQTLRDAHVPFETVEDDAALCATVAADLDAGSVIGWFQERMEFGPRALGARSILGDPRRPDMQSLINQKVKFREGFRPFAPIVLKEHAHEYFGLTAQQDSPYMLVVVPVNESQRNDLSEAEQGAKGLDRLAVTRSKVPSITHVDFSARVQTVDRQRNPRLRQLLEAFHRRTGCPVLINTSFNLGWEPIVASPKEALATFMASNLDVLVLGNTVVRKSDQPATVAATPSEGPDPVLADRWACPRCGRGLARQGTEVRCGSCQQVYPVHDGIPGLFWPHETSTDGRDVTDVVKDFYEQTPFPNYDDHDSVRSLMDKSRRGRYARRLDETIPWNSAVLEVGCGTGQLTNFLGMSCRQVIGTDMCLNSLRLGEQFRQTHGLERVRFVQMNLFRPAFRERQFDVILCNGVLHHTAWPFEGFQSLVPLLKPGGHFVVGLYNRYGRLLTDLRRSLFRLTGGRARWIDPILRRDNLSQDKRRAWFADQYRHPHESKHTMGEILGWFERTGLSFVRGIPALRPEDDGLGGRDLFEPQSPGTALERGVVQFGEILAAGQKEGGFFLMIGRRPEDAG